MEVVVEVTGLEPFTRIPKACKIKGFIINNSQVNQKLITKILKKETT